ncbi:hypothetical protein PG989_012780 [Apiospora arundinis]
MKNLPPFPEFSLSGAVAILITLGIIDATQRTDFQFRCMLFAFMFYAMNVVLDVVNKTYDPQALKMAEKRLSHEFPFETRPAETRPAETAPSEINYADFITDDDYVSDYGHVEPDFNWEKVFKLLEDLTLLMSRARMFELNLDEHESQMSLKGTRRQIGGLVAVLQRVTKQQEYDTAFIEFITIEPSEKWIKSVEDFLSPRPTSQAELIFICHECLNSQTVDCLKNAQLRDVPGYREHVDKIMSIILQDESERRVELLNAVQDMVGLATTPRLREDLHLTITARRNGMQPLSRMLTFAKDLSLEGVKLFRHRVDNNQWPGFLESLLEAAEDVTDPGQFDCIMSNTGRLLREIHNMTIQTFLHLRQKLRVAEQEVKSIQSNITQNWRLLVNTPGFNRSAFVDNLIRLTGMEPSMALGVVESLHLACLEAIHVAEPSADDVPDSVKELSYIDLVKLHNIIVKHPNVRGRRGSIVVLWSQTPAINDEGRPPSFQEATSV